MDLMKSELDTCKLQKQRIILATCTNILLNEANEQEI